MFKAEIDDSKVVDAWPVRELAEAFAGITRWKTEIAEAVAPAAASVDDFKARMANALVDLPQFEIPRPRT